jgi:hypothetical protein
MSRIANAQARSPDGPAPPRIVAMRPPARQLRVAGEIRTAELKRGPNSNAVACRRDRRPEHDRATAVERCFTFSTSAGKLPVGYTV